MLEIYNDTIKAIINPVGAELEGLFINDINILWERNEQIWNSQSPILFPIVGGLKDGYYIYNDDVYKLPSHGFVRNMDFKVEIKQQNKLVLSHSYDNNTLACYPFKYKLLVGYEIINKELNVNISVINLDEKDIYFSVGFHPGFSYTGLKSICGNDLSLNINPNKTNEILFSPSYYVGNEEKTFKETSFNEITKELIIKRTLCYQNIDKVEVKCDKKLSFFTNMEYVAFWQKSPEDNPTFLCIEGWNGLPDSVNTNHRIEDKIGIIKLEKYKTHNSLFKIKVEGK